MNLYQPDPKDSSKNKSIDNSQTEGSDKKWLMSNFDFKDYKWSFTPIDYKIRDRIKATKNKLLNKVKVELAKISNQELEGDSQELIEKYLRDFFAFIKIAYDKDRLFIVNQEEDTYHYPYRLVEETNLMRSETYEYFLRYAFGQILNFPVNEINVYESQKISLTLPIVLSNIKEFLEQY